MIGLNFGGRLRVLAAGVFAVVVGLFGGGCATDRPVVKGMFDPGGVIYRSSESEEWGSRSTVKVQPLEF